MSVEKAFYINRNMSTPECIDNHATNASIFVSKDVHKVTNEDAAVVLKCSDQKMVCAIADGMGGHPQGDVASRIAVEELARQVSSAAIKDSYRGEILDAYESANQKIIDLKVGAGTTLIVVEIHGRELRVYHAGDSAMALIGGRGRLKYRTVGHSPYDLGQEAGLLETEDKLDEHLRGTVTNILGSSQMRVELGPTLTLAPRDYVVVGSDGLFDNLSYEEISSQLRAKVFESCHDLAKLAQENMNRQSRDFVGKPDDLSVFVCRNNIT